MKKSKNKIKKEKAEIASAEKKLWVLKDISPDVKKIVKDSAKKQGIKIGEWITQAILESSTPAIEKKNLKDSLPEMEEFPDKTFMKNYFMSLESRIDDLAKKVDKPWWKFWA